MMFNLIFSAISSLYFSLEFEINLHRQDYFFFEGENQTAHCYQINNTVTLLLSHLDNFSVYKKNVTGDSFTFTWQGFLVNGEEMKKDSTFSEIPNLSFENFTFLSPIIRYLDDNIEPVYQMEDSFNYWYIALIIFTLGILFESKSRGLQFLRQILTKNHSNEKSCESDEEQYTINLQ